MEHVKINDWSYLDLGDDSGSDNDAGSSSDDDIEVILHGTPEQKRKLRERINKNSESDEFEMEMDEELERRVGGADRFMQPDIHAQQKRQSKKHEANDQLDDNGDSDDDDDDDDLAMGPKLSNDDLFYDPNMDDDDQKWVDSQRSRHRSYTNETSNKRQAAPNSDAVLDCPACLTTLCVDCQRHAIYQNQYRAMFVMNCSVDTSQRLIYPEQSRKRGKKKRDLDGGTKQSRVVSAGSGVVGEESGTESLEQPHPTDYLKESNNCLAEITKTNLVADDDMSTTIKSHMHHTTVIDSEMRSSDQFYGVNCSVCSTAVAVVDRDEVYHFYNVIAAYT